MNKFSIPIWNKYFSVKEQIILALVVLFGLIIRIVNAAVIPFWRDEIYNLFVAKNNSFLKLITQQHWDTAHPPLYSTFLHFWQMVSINPIWLRIPSLIASLFILYLIPILAIKISRKYKSFPFILLFIFSISHTHISLNMVARPYPFVSLFVILSLILFFSMLESKPKNHTTMIIFGLTNFLAIATDYSSIWLFMTYSFFFLFYFFTQKKGSTQVVYIFRSLLLSAVLSLLVLPFLLINLGQSLHLERGIPSLKATKPNITANSTFYVLISQNNRKVAFYNSSFHELSSSILPNYPFPNNQIRIGYALSPLSTLLINNFSYCKVANQSNVETWKGCQFTPLNTPLRHFTLEKMSTSVKSVPIGNSLLLSNLMANKWESPIYGKSIPINNEDIVFKLSMFSTYSDYPSGITIYGQSFDKDNPQWHSERIINIYISEYNYKIDYQVSENDRYRLFGENGFLEKMSGSIDFFCGIPTSFSIPFRSLLISFLFICSIIVYLRGYVKDKNSIYTYLLFLFFIPIIVSYVVSYYWVPIFLGRNLYVVSISYIIGLSLLISQFMHRKSFFALIGSGLILFLIYIFISYYPYIHYIDPPYEMRQIISTILTNTNADDRIEIIVDNEEYYRPLLYYEMLRENMGKKRHITVTSLGRINNLKRMKLTKIEGINHPVLFFIQFPSDNNPFGQRLIKLSQELQCKLKVYSLNYVYFGKCE